MRSCAVGEGAKHLCRSAISNAVVVRLRQLRITESSGAKSDSWILRWLYLAAAAAACQVAL